MAQTEAFIETLKQVLRQHKITYADIGNALGMSEANIKRQFASKRFTLDRIESICQLMKMELTDLFQLYDDSRNRVSQLSIQQERELVQDTKLLLVAANVRNHLTFNDLLNHFHLDESECIQYLAKLDRLKIITLLPNNRIKLQIAEDFHWLPDGPIEQFFTKELQGQFLKSRFSGVNSQRRFLFGLLSEQSIQILMNKIQVLEKEFTELLRKDAKLPFEKRHSVGFMLALRPWQADLFNSLMRSD